MYTLRALGVAACSLSVACSSPPRHSDSTGEEESLIPVSAQTPTVRAASQPTLNVEILTVAPRSPIKIIRSEDGCVVSGIRFADLVESLYHVPSFRVYGAGRMADQRLEIRVASYEGPQERQIQEALAVAVGCRFIEQWSVSEVIVMRSSKEVPESASELSATTMNDHVVMASGLTVAGIAAVLSSALHTNVVDETELNGRYDLSVVLPEGATWQSSNVLTLLSDQSGFQLSREKRPVRSVLVEWNQE